MVVGSTPPKSRFCEAFLVGKPRRSYLDSSNQSRPAIWRNLFKPFADRPSLLLTWLGSNPGAVWLALDDGPRVGPHRTGVGALSS